MTAPTTSDGVRIPLRIAVTGTDWVWVRAAHRAIEGAADMIRVDSGPADLVVVCEGTAQGALGTAVAGAGAVAVAVLLSTQMTDSRLLAEQDLAVVDTSRLAGPEQLADAFRAAAAGRSTQDARPHAQQPPQSPILGDQLVARGRALGLGRRQLELLTLLECEPSIRAIARRLIVSERTIRRHLAAVGRTLGCRPTREALLHCARTQNLLPPRSS